MSLILNMQRESLTCKTSILRSMVMMGSEAWETIKTLSEGFPLSPTRVCSFYACELEYRIVCDTRFACEGSKCLSRGGFGP